LVIRPGSRHIPGRHCGKNAPLNEKICILLTQPSLIKTADQHIDHHLLLALAAGDRTAFARIFEQSWAHVYGVALRLTKSPEMARDLAQDIFLKLWDHRDKLTKVNNFYSFLYTITRNQVHDQLRKKVFRESNREFLVNYFSAGQTTIADSLESRELDRLLYESIEKLPPQLRQVLRLGRLEGLSHEEIAAKMGITPQSSRTYMARAVAALHKTMITNNEKTIIVMLMFLLC
jgi:RNA polymerase sigma-70 factor (family 1)